MPVEPNRVETIFNAALAVAPADRAAFLDAQCGNDAELRGRVERLLAAHSALGDSPTADRPPDPSTATFGDVGHTSDHTPRPDVGTVIGGKYKLVEEIGEGGMGTVWMAQQTEPVKRVVAVKLIKAGMDSRAVLARFEAERQALALMDHPNIAKVLDAGATPDGRPYFVMELVKGVPITQYCDERKLTPRQRLELFVPVCQAIQHAHQKGVIHRDIKPSNVLIALYDDRPVPKVIDFGVAKAAGQPLTEKTLATGFGSVVGTPEYMSPEQASFNNLDIDTRSDVYALGVLLYELLAGAPPFSRADLEKVGLLEIFRVIREQEPPRPSTKLSSAGTLPALSANRGTEPAKLTRLLRGELDWIVMKALEKDRNRRYETANGLARDIQRYLADEVVEARPPSAGYRVRKFVSRNRGRVVAASLVLLALVAGMGGTALGLVRALKAEEQAKKDRDDAIAARDAETLALERVKEERRRADDEAATATAYSEFFRDDLLRQTDPQHQIVDRDHPTRNPNITVRELLDRTAKTIDKKFPGRPLVEAAIRLTLAETYMGMGEPALARPHAQRAVELRVAHLPGDHPDVLRAKCTLGFFLGGAEAETLFRDVIGVWERQLGADAPDVVRAKFGLSGALAAQGKHDWAVPLFKEVIVKWKVIFGADSPHIFPPTGGLAESYFALGDYDNAEALWTEMLATPAGRDWANWPNTRRAKFFLGFLYLLKEKYELAEPTLRASVDTTAAAHGIDHFWTLRVSVPLGITLLKQQRWDNAATLLSDCLRRGERTNPDPWLTFSTKAWLGAARLGQKRLGEAELLLLSGYEGLKQHETQMPPYAKLLTPKVVDQLILLYEATGKPDDVKKWRAERAKYPPHTPKR